MFVEFAVLTVVSVTGSDDGCSVVAGHLKGMASRLRVEESLGTKWFRQSENSTINIWTTMMTKKNVSEDEHVLMHAD